MQDGIGRGGYRVLAFVFFAVGALGLAIAAVALSPAGLFEWLGIALAAIALATLTGLILATLGPMAFATPAPRPDPAGAPDTGVVPLPTPEPPTMTDPGADLGFEYPEVEPLAPAPDQPALTALYPPPSPPRPARPLATPPAMARPAQRSAPPAGKADSGDWPERRGKAGVTRREVAERNAPRASPGPDIESDGAPAGRREPPIVMARTVASAEATGIPDGTGVGKCGNCGVLLLAPKKRPIRLQCPRCERVHTLA
ncbi:MAG: hypothetical protein QOJ26_661 [Thermoplasmata archaeon]|nr:hypothetical protein [Thermoplasmata archaeon]MEA3165795.1 hypothetical protein [Thermoplasmata archaeon]